MERIDFPGLDKFIRHQQAAYRKLGYKTDDDAETRHPVLAGFATQYNAPLFHDGIHKLLAPGAFSKSLARGKRVNFQVQHEDSTVAAHTDGALELHENAEGVFFRLPLRHVKNGALLARLVESGSRTCASVGYRVVSAHTEFRNGQNLQVIGEAILNEISICKLGAMARAFCYLTDDVATASIKGMNKSTLFALESAIHRTSFHTKRDKLLRIVQLQSERGLSDEFSACRAALDCLLRDLRNVRV